MRLGRAIRRGVRSPRMWWAERGNGFRVGLATAAFIIYVSTALSVYGDVENMPLMVGVLPGIVMVVAGIRWLAR